MPNFDQFERLMRRGLVEHETHPEVAKEMSSLYDAARPKFARGRSHSDLQDWLSRAVVSLNGMFTPGEFFTTSEDNSFGKDLLAVRSGREIELKSPDGKTDANVGIASIAWALDDTTARLSTIMTSGMAERRRIWQTVSDEEVRAREVHDSKLSQMHELVTYFSERVQVGEPVKERLDHYVRSVARGLTKLKEITTSFDMPAARGPLLLVSNWDMGLIEYRQNFAESETISVTSLTSSPLTGRVSLKLSGETSLRACEIYPHHKNSYKHASGVIPASAWVNTACFHIWID